MTLRNRYRLLGGSGRALRKGFIREVVLPIAAGVLIGLLLGRFYQEQTALEGQDIHRHSYVRKLHLDEYEYPDGSIFFLRCIVFLHNDAKKPISFIMAIRDTYSQQCNQTIYYTSNSEIQKKVLDQNVFYIDSNSNAFYWNYFINSLNHSSTIPAMWTVVLDEQVFLKVSNLRRALMNFDFKEKLMLGRVIESGISRLFPFISNTRLSLQAGIVISHSALKALTSCNNYLWPRTTEKTLFECAEEKRIPIVDPVDEDNMHLFHYTDIKTLVPKGKDGDHSCCSDHAVSFGQQSYKEIRMAYYASETWSVFGVHGILEVNATYAIDRKHLIHTTPGPKTTTTRKPTAAPKKKTTTAAPKKKATTAAKKKAS